LRRPRYPLFPYTTLFRSVEARDGRVHVIEREVVAPLAVLGLVIDRAAFDLDLTAAEIALVVGHVVVGVPEAELQEREQLQRARRSEEHTSELQSLAYLVC